MIHGRIRTRANTSNNNRYHIGVGLQVGLGYLKSDNPFVGKQLLTSAIIALVVSFTVVATAVQSILKGADDMTVFLILIGVVAAMAGIDQLVKNTGGAITSALSNKQKK
ncbi:MAG: hypothetical protein OEM28_08545 [Nitrosopumilus sp.]|nr:hypothetical protein [Nitrosopumilus sp.]MDH3487899.1 hypothetical protein [Nitrosopumilus sp.]